MILESKIKDASKVTFDCAKATIERGSRIEIDDVYWKNPEIQNAIKIGFCAIVGEPPILPEDTTGVSAEAVVRFRNNFSTKLCFECIKDYADPGMFIRVPVSLIDNAEIRNAIMAGWLINEDNPAANPDLYKGPPMHLEELRVSDIVDGVDSDLAGDLAKIMSQPVKQQALPEGIPVTRPTKKAQSQIKAKRVGAVGDSDYEDSSADELYKPSEVRLPKSKTQTKRTVEQAAPSPSTEVSGDDDFDFTDIFSNKKKK